MQNTLQDLNNYLFEAIERVGDDDLTEEQLEKETKKAETIVKIGQAIISNAKIQLDAWKEANEQGLNVGRKAPSVLITEKKGGTSEE